MSKKKATTPEEFQEPKLPKPDRDDLVKEDENSTNETSEGETEDNGEPDPPGGNRPPKPPIIP